MNGLESVSKERQDQLTKHKRSIEDDIKYNYQYQLVDAASVLSMPVPDDMIKIYQESYADNLPEGWDKEIWKKMVMKPYRERLIIAAALLVAEIDRWDNIPKAAVNQTFRDAVN